MTPPEGEGVDYQNWRQKLTKGEGFTQYSYVTSSIVTEEARTLFSFFFKCILNTKKTRKNKKQLFKPILISSTFKDTKLLWHDKSYF